MCPTSLMCLMFYKFKLQNIFGQDNFLSHGFLHVLCYFQHFLKHIRHIRNIGHMNWRRACCCVYADYAEARCRGRPNFYGTLVGRRDTSVEGEPYSQTIDNEWVTWFINVASYNFAGWERSFVIYYGYYHIIFSLNNAHKWGSKLHFILNTNIRTNINLR